MIARAIQSIGSDDIEALVSNGVSDSRTIEN